MDISQLQHLLQQVQSGDLSVESAIAKIKRLPLEYISSACIDHHRHLRSGVPEVIFGLNKDDEEIIAIAEAMYKQSGRFLITKARVSVFEKLNIAKAEWHPKGAVISCGGLEPKRGNILILTAGTSDITVAEEALVTARFLGNRADMIYDVGVAGIHRLFSNIERLTEAKVLIVVAGMEGALPSVVGGLIDKPIIAVPTSAGYGTSLGGLTALFAMLNSCVPGIAVMNIDNGFGAACLAHRINCLAF